MATITLDPVKLNASFAALLPQHIDAQATKAQDKAVSNFAGLSLPDVSSTVEAAKAFDASICAWWPKIHTFVGGLVSMFGWAIPGAAGPTKAFLQWFDTELYPVLCQKPKP